MDNPLGREYEGNPDFAEHLPSLTDVNKEENTIENFYKEMILNFIK